MNNLILKVAVDFGSTTSVMGWQWFEQHEKKRTAASPATIRKYPTVILEASDNPGLNADVFGEDAQHLQAKLPNKELTVKTGFKRKLLFPANNREYLEGKQLTKKFFKYLYQEFENESPLRENSERHIELLLTVPLGALAKSIQDLKQIAGSSGFSQKNGFENVTVINEARCLTDCAFSQANGFLLSHLHDLAGHPESSELALFVDIGGLTGDFTLARVHYDTARSQFILDEIPMDYTISDGSDLGGIELDKALMEYLQENRFINPREAKAYEAKRQLEVIRAYKEQANDQYWKKDLAPKDLGAIPASLAPWRSQGKPEQPLLDYSAAEDKQLSPMVMRKCVAAKYIGRLADRIKKFFNDAQIDAADVDWIFLTGGGSKMFFMPQLFRGELAAPGGQRLNFKKIQLEENRLVCWDDPTTSCLRGALAENDMMEFLRASNAVYCIRMVVNIKKGLITDQTQEFLIPLSQKNETLPIQITGDKYVEYQMSSMVTKIEINTVVVASGAATQRFLQTQAMDASGGLDSSGVRMAMRKNNAALAEDVVEIGGGVLKTLGLLALGCAVPNMRMAAAQYWSREIQNKNIKLNNKYYDTLHIQYQFEIDQNGGLTGRVQGFSPVLNQGNGGMELVIS